MVSLEVELLICGAFMLVPGEVLCLMGQCNVCILADSHVYGRVFVLLMYVCMYWLVVV